MRKDGVSNPHRSRIRVVPGEGNIFLPVVCQQCEEAPCAEVCPREAVWRDKELGRTVIDYDRCVSCRMCEAVCPFGAIGFDRDRGRIFKCDLCNGDPQCVRFCYPEALGTAEAHMIQYPRAREVALKTRGIRRKENVFFSGKRKM